jgi:indolepyruvate ferredoxin oxidoreductase alpha subunit
VFSKEKELKRLLSGNEAIALGAYHAGVKVATAYPGTPSTEILESLARYEGVYVEWSPNEKVAMDVGVGAAYAGARALVSMKMVGLNVAADPFFAASYTGVRGGLVVVSADDPYIHSSQNEQDNRNYAKFAKVPLLEPTDSQEAYELVDWAFRISEEFDTPVLLRTTTRISHSKSVVEVQDSPRPSSPLPPFVRNPQKYVMIPAHARKRHVFMEQRLERLALYAESFPFNQMLLQERRLGIIADGVAYQYAREVFPEASFLKLVMSFPLPGNLVRHFASQVERVIVIEELDPFLEEAVRLLGIEVTGKQVFPLFWELNPDIVAESARQARLLPDSFPPSPPVPPRVELPERPPRFCPGCPHAATFFVLRRLGLYQGTAEPESPPERRALSQLKRSGLIIAGDLGCYTLSVLPPLLAMDTQGCMGASIGNALGLEKAGVRNKVVAVLGDSTFMHTGISGLLDVVYNQGKVTTIILDNAATAMTGHQGHPGSGISARGERTRAVDLAQLARSMGVEDVHVVGAYELELIEATIKRCIETEEPSVIIVRGACPVYVKIAGEPLRVDREKCDGCSTCLRLGCPALSLQESKAQIEISLCTGDVCNLCGVICPRQAILPLSKNKAEEIG